MEVSTRGISNIHVFIIIYCFLFGFSLIVSCYTAQWAYVCLLFLLNLAKLSLQVIESKQT